TDFAVTREPLPRTNLGKVQRHKLEERYQNAKQGRRSDGKRQGASEQMSEEDRTLLNEPIAQQTFQWLKERFPDNQVTMDKSPSIDLNIDSLEWMNLTLELRETTGVELTEDALARVDTVRDLIQEVVNAASSGGADKGSPLLDPDKFIKKDEKRWL